MLSDFKKFVLRGNVVDLAAAVVVGVAFTAMVTALVADLITPLIAAIFGKPNFNDLSFTLNHSTSSTARSSTRCCRSSSLRPSSSSPSSCR